MRHYVCARKELIIICFLIILLGSCKKFVDPGSPETSITGVNVFSEDKTAISVLNGIYLRVVGGDQFATGQNSLSLVCGLSADEFSVFTNFINPLKNGCFANGLNSTSFAPDYWNTMYESVAKCNSAIEGLGSSTITPRIKQQLLAEAKFFRAFCFFYLVNLYGDVPLVLTTNFQESSVMPRTSKIVVYDQIIKDLKEAQNELSNVFLDGDLQPNTSAERVRPTKWSATALLARVYLYLEDWANAESESGKLIDNSLFSLSSINKTFLKSSLGNNEAIWQLQPASPNRNTFDGYVFIVPATGPSMVRFLQLNSQLLDAFEPGDQRVKFGNWIDSISTSGDLIVYPYKYKLSETPEVTLNSGAASMSEFVMVFRLAEQYLIRSEARAHQSNIDGAKSDLDIIRARAGLPGTAANDQETLLSAVLHERQVELFSEWGHRWFDLKRTKKVDAVMNGVTPLKGGTWETTDQYYPIPANEIMLNHNLIQNDGY